MDTSPRKTNEFISADNDSNEQTGALKYDFNAKTNILLLVFGAIGLIFLYVITGFNTSNIFLLILIIAFSLMMLLGACEFVIEYAVRLSRLLKIREIIIGLTIVSVGTSIPEISTSIISAIYGFGGVAVGDVYGSYITQSSIILGIVVLLNTESVSKKNTPYVQKDILLMLGAIFVNFLVLIFDSGISTLGASILVGLFLLYLILQYRKIKNEQIVNETLDIEARKKIETMSKSQKVIKTLEYIAIIFVSIILVVIGAQSMVIASANLARQLHVSDHVIGVTIIAFGTAVPEFAVSFSAMRKNETEIAYGNLIGSNIVDPLFSLGIGALFRPILMNPEVVNQIITEVLPFNIICAFCIFIFFSKKKESKAWGSFTGITMISIYVTFILVHFL